MNSGQGLLIGMAVAAIVVIPADMLYTSRFVPRFKEIEKQRIVTSNQLATAKIVSENLNHVRDLVFGNMEFTGQKDSIPQETQLFDFLTACVNDLKMRVVAVKLNRPVTQGRVTTTGYDIDLQGDFFSFGELCSKFENSRRVMAITSFSVRQADRTEPTAEASSAPGKRGKAAAPAPVSTGRWPIAISLHLDTYRVRKG